MVRVLADVTGLSKSFKDTGSKASEAAKTAQESFGRMLGTLNQTGVLGPFGEILSQVNDSIGDIIEHGHKMSDVMLGAGGAVAGVGTLMSSLGSKEKAAHQQLAAAIDATGGSFDQYGKQIDEAIKHEAKYGNSSVETQQALQALTQATHSPAEALKLLGTATDLAAAKHESLSAAAASLGKVYNGNAKLLKEYGIVLDKHTHLTKDGQTATQALAGVLKGQAAAAADTFNGKMKEISTTIENHVSLISEKYGPALQGAGAALAGLGAIMKTGKAVMDIFTAGTEAATAATDAATVSEDAAAVSEGLALLPILAIIAAIALLVVAAYEIYSHWKEIWAGIKAIVVDVWDWIKTNWPLLVAILLGPIAIAALEIAKHWKEIVDGVEAVIDWVRTHWPLILDILLGPVGLAIGQIVQHWNDFIGFFSGLPGRITSIAAHMWDGIWSAFRSVLNGLIDLWNRLHFTLPKINMGPIHIGGETIGVPTIPHLAQGGLMTQSGLVFAHAGEVISPAPAAARGGPAVNIEHATFATELDVEAFMRKAAWVARTQAV
jgi:hypothetical protein